MSCDMCFFFFFNSAWIDDVQPPTLRFIFCGTRVVASTAPATTPHPPLLSSTNALSLRGEEERTRERHGDTQPFVAPMGTEIEFLCVTATCPCPQVAIQKTNMLKDYATRGKCNFQTKHFLLHEVEELKLSFGGLCSRFWPSSLPYTCPSSTRWHTSRFKKKLMKLSFFFRSPMQEKYVGWHFPKLHVGKLQLFSKKAQQSSANRVLLRTRLLIFLTWACTPKCIINYAVQHVHPRHRTHTGTPCRHRSTTQCCV